MSDFAPILSKFGISDRYLFKPPHEMSHKPVQWDPR